MLEALVLQLDLTLLSFDFNWNFTAFNFFFSPFCFGYFFSVLHWESGFSYRLRTSILRSWTHLQIDLKSILGHAQRLCLKLEFYTSKRIQQFCSMVFYTLSRIKDWLYSIVYKSRIFSNFIFNSILCVLCARLPNRQEFIQTCWSRHSFFVKKRRV